MKTRVWAARILLALALAAAAGMRSSADPFTVTVVVNGNKLPASAVEIQNETVYVALRPIAVAMQADVETNARARTVTITTLLRQVVLHLDDQMALVNGQRVRLAAAPTQSGSRIVLPLRAVGEAFGATVTYNGKTRTALVTPATRTAQGGHHPLSGAASAKTMSGSVLAVNASVNPPNLLVSSGGSNYTITVPSGTSIAFRDVHGAVTGNGKLAQVRPGDALIVTVDPHGQLISMADIFASINGTAAAVADQSMVLEGGRVIVADALTSVSLDGKAATFSLLRRGDKVSIRADPVSGAVREVVALRPGGFATTASSTPAPGAQSGGGAVQIKAVHDNATTAFRAGQTVTVLAQGTPGAQASFDLSDVIVDNGMRETSPGRYEGQYLVGVGTNLVAAPILVRLSKSGETALAEAPNPLTIITTPPSVSNAAPLPYALVNTARPSIFATFSTLGDLGMDASSLQMILNGRDVTSQATRDAAYISYYPAAELSSKTVQIEVKGTDTAGNTLDYRWTFSIAGK
ncbi:MAG: copper amine oxidase N-terminal domain-containing protein [Candidatus Eremiobacteraeota bacterium]|nr:copper amine oxidase N-terminal domain-containing protein [Candidatus Eremiobacteraeota bacterium]